jgi:DNA-binding transcriptional MerR regulator
MGQSEQTLLTGKAAELAGVHQQTIIKWAKEGLLRPSKRRTKDSPRRYTFQDTVAASIAQMCLQAGIERKVVRKIVKIVQRADPYELERAAIVTVVDRTTRFPRIVFYPDVVDKSQWSEIESHGEAGEIAQVQTLKEIVDALLKKVQEIINADGIAQRSAEAE